MGSYIANFTVYTMAMLGLIFFALFVYKKFMNGGLGGSSSKFLSIEETMNINPRKSLLVVRAGNEKFLVASDVDRTTLLSKLSDSKSSPQAGGYEHFENILQEDCPPPKRIQVPPNRIIDKDIVQNEKPIIHLEPIKEKNPQASHLRRGMDRRERETSKSREHSPKQNVVLDFNKPADHGLTTIREMAKKINEL